jgi:hypothetical protein
LSAGRGVYSDRKLKVWKEEVMIEQNKQDILKASHIRVLAI